MSRASEIIGVLNHNLEMPPWEKDIISFLVYSHGEASLDDFNEQFDDDTYEANLMLTHLSRRGLVETHAGMVCLIMTVTSDKIILPGLGEEFSFNGVEQVITPHNIKTAIIRASGEDLSPGELRGLDLLLRLSYRNGGGKSLFTAPVSLDQFENDKEFSNDFTESLNSLEDKGFIMVDDSIYCCIDSNADHGTYFDAVKRRSNGFFVHVVKGSGCKNLF